MRPLDRLESEVRSYVRTFPVVFDTARGAVMIDEDGVEYVDFFAGAGALNYGHNPPQLRDALIDYLHREGITHSLDLATVAKRRFMERFESIILEPRGLTYRLAFPGPTGTNAVEVALKLARKATGRTEVVAFRRGFHGMTLGSLALTGDPVGRGGAGVPLEHTRIVPFDGDLGPDVDTVGWIAQLLAELDTDGSLPAAFVLETVQAEGGVRPCSVAWLRRLAALARAHGIVLIVDDIQVGCGRTGPFFSFEGSGVEPDLVCLSKSLSGYGLPMSMVLVRPELDVLRPGEHSGTFRGHMPAFVTATAALEHSWRDDALTRKVERDAAHTRRRLQEAIAGTSTGIRGRGMIQGLVFPDPDDARHVVARCFERGLVIERAGPGGGVVKLLPPLTIERALLDRGLDILAEAVGTVAGRASTIG